RSLGEVDRAAARVRVAELCRQIEDVLTIGTTRESEQVSGRRGRCRDRLVDTRVRTPVSLLHVQLRNRVRDRRAVAGQLELHRYGAAELESARSIGIDRLEVRAEGGPV